MTRFRLAAGRLSILPVAAALLFAAAVLASAAEEFPFDRELVLDAAPLGRGKHMPMLVVTPSGDATIELWCKTVGAHADIAEDTIAIKAEPLPDALPAMMGRDQCTPARMQADADLLDAIAQATSWHKQGSGLVLVGPKTLTFRLSDH